MTSKTQKQVFNNSCEGIAQTVSRVVMILLVYPLYQMINYNVLYQKYRYQRNPNQYDEDLKFFSGVLIFAIIFGILRQIFNVLLTNIIYSTLKPAKYPSDQERQLRTKQIVLFIFEIHYYGAASILGYFLMRNNQNFTDGIKLISVFFHIFKDTIAYKYDDNLQLTDQMIIYYMIQFGFQFQIFILHFTKTYKTTFYEMLLHHILTITLITTSYLNDQIFLGTMVLFLHDISDFFLFLSRICNDFKLDVQIYTIISFAMTLIAWLVTRLIIFPKTCVFEILFLSYNNLNNLDEKKSNGFSVLFYQEIFLTILFLMHIYWYILFLRILYNKVFKKKDFNDAGFVKKQKKN